MNANNAVSDDWKTTPNMYWDAWFDLTRRTLGVAASDGEAPDAWGESFWKWWQTISSASPAAGQHFDERLLALGRVYFGFGERLAKSGGQDVGAAFEQWLEHVSGAFSMGTSDKRATEDRSVRDVLAFWELPLDTWQRTMSSMLPLPGDYLKAFQDGSSTRTAQEGQDRVDRFLAIPAVGYSREAQEQHQKLTRLVRDYLKALQEYNVGFTRVGTRSIETFRSKVNEASASAPVDSLRKLYDLWVDACEEVYAEHVRSDEYASRYGQMVNALMAVKQQGALLVDGMLAGMNVPTRRDMNTLYQRLHDTRRENRSLHAEIEGVRERVDSLEAVKATAPHPAPRRAPSPDPSPATPSPAPSRVAPRRRTKGRTRRKH
jgi:class III poly(R)-hydroxyalkanoic acid synthase PhaE subunit